MRHAIYKVDESGVAGSCSICGPVPIYRTADSRYSEGYRYRCSNARKREDKRFSYRKHKKDTCERCSFVPEHPCQLDVDHVDGDKRNNDPANLRTLCANCHRLKTHSSNDYTRRYHGSKTALVVESFVT